MRCLWICSFDVSKSSLISSRLTVMAFDHLGSLSLFSCMLCGHLFFHSFPLPRRVFRKHFIISYPHYKYGESLHFLFIMSDGKITHCKYFYIYFRVWGIEVWHFFPHIFKKTKTNGTLITREVTGWSMRAQWLWVELSETSPMVFSSLQSLYTWGLMAKTPQQ